MCPASMGGLMEQVPVVRCLSMDDAIARVIALKQPHLLIVDIEPGVANWNADAEQRNREIVRVHDALSRAGHTVWFVSNGSFTVDTSSGVRVTTRARKPWTSIHKRPAGAAGLPCVVIGDQVWTDGLLAYRLRAGFLMIDLPREGVPLWPRLQRRFSWTPPAMFRQVDRHGDGC